MKIELENGKYTVTFEEGTLTARRYGERWRNLTGDNLFLCMAQEIERLRGELGVKNEITDQCCEAEEKFGLDELEENATLISKLTNLRKAVNHHFSNRTRSMEEERGFCAGWKARKMATFFRMYGLNPNIQEMPQTIVWTMVDARELIIRLAPALDYAGWGCGIAGSVLEKGVSSNDLDLIVFPLKTGKVDRQALYATLERFHLKRQCTIGHVHAAWWKDDKDADSKHVEVWRTSNSKRIDLFILS